MSDDMSFQSVEDRVPESTSVAQEQPKVEKQEDSASLEPNTKGMLRDAIQKVMGEIEYHEREAKRHVKLAEDLRKDLRESFTFMLQQKDEKPRTAADKDRASKTLETTAADKTKDVPDKRPGPAKKRPGRKSR
jgi:hypothetical protein